MNPIKPSQLATYLKVGRSAISNALKVRNGNPAKLKIIEINKEKLIDVDDKYNINYIEESCIRNGIAIPDFNNEPVVEVKKVKVKKVIEKKEKVNIKQSIDFDDDDEKEVDLVAEKRKWDIEKVKAQTEKERINIEKISGNLLPIDETMHVLNFVVSNYTSSARSHFISFLSLIVKELGGTDEDYKTYLDQLDEGLVEFAENSITEIEDGVDGVVEQYQETRSRGERK